MSNSTVLLVLLKYITTCPKIRTIDFSNIETIIEQRVFNISSIISIEKINKLIKSLLNGKALKLDSIPNKVLKVVILVIVKDLIKTTSYYFASGIIPKSLKKFITIMLYKKGKKNSLLGSYRLITFKNILTKVLKIYITNIMSKAAKEHKLLF